MDTDEIMQKQVEQLEKEKKEMQEKLRTQEKKVIISKPFFLFQVLLREMASFRFIYTLQDLYTQMDRNGGGGAFYGVQSIGVQNAQK